MIKYITPNGIAFDHYKSLSKNRIGVVTCMKDIVIMQLSSNLSYIRIDISTGEVKLGITDVDF